MSQNGAEGRVHREARPSGKTAIGNSNMKVEPLIGTTGRRADMLINKTDDPTIMCVPNDSNIHAKYIVNFKIIGAI